MIKRIFFSFLWPYLLFALLCVKATETFELHGNKNIEIKLESGGSIQLEPGALISISQSEDAGWARSIQVIRRSGDDSVQTEPIWGKIGKQSLDDYFKQGLIKEFSSKNKQSNVFKVEKVGKIEVLSGSERLFLEVGDKFELIESSSQSWKAPLIILSSGDSRLIGKNVFIGSNYLNQLIDSGHIEVQDSNASVAFAKVSFSEERSPAGTEEFELSTQLDCPKFGEYRVEQSFFFDALDDRLWSDALSIPTGSIIKVIEGEDSRRCHFVLVEASSPEHSDHLGQELLTYPRNLTDQSLSVYLSKKAQIKAESNQLDFHPGTRFVLNSPGRLSAYNVETGRSQTVPAGSVLNVKQARPHFIQLHGKNGEHFVVERSELESLRTQGQVSFDSTRSLDQTLNEIEKLKINQSWEKCPPGTTEHVDWESEDPIVWESCQEKDLVGSNGRTLPANNYYDDLISKLSDFGQQKNELWLQKSDQRELTKCVKQSLRGGLRRNVLPVCDTDSQGDLIKRPIRKTVIKTNSKGKRYPAQEILTPAPRACASEATSSFLAKSFDKASRCLGLDPRELFDLINHESNFQPGAISRTGALSVGQTVISNYLQIHKSLERAELLISEGGERLEALKKFSKPETYRQGYENSNKRAETRYTVFLVSELEDKIKNPKAHGCEDLSHLLDNPINTPSGVDPAQHVLNTENKRLCLPHQPGQSFLMAGLDYLANKKYAQALIGNWVSDPEASTEHLQDITKILGKWMYNGGQEGITRSFEYFMNELKSGRVTMRDDELKPVLKNGETQIIRARSLNDLGLEDFKKYMSVHIKQEYPGSRSRKTEVAGYIQKMERDIQRLKDRGLKCTL